MRYFTIKSNILLQNALQGVLLMITECFKKKRVNLNRFIQGNTRMVSGNPRYISHIPTLSCRCSHY